MRATITALVTILAAAAALAAPGRAAATGTMCGQYDTQPAGQYLISQDAWGYTAYNGQQCITPAPDGFTVTTSAAAGTNVQGYPNIGKGCGFDLASCTPAAGMPARVTQLGALHSSWSTSQAAAGEWDAAFDMYAGDADTKATLTKHTEVMVWLNSKNVLIPPCTRVYLDSTYWCEWSKPIVSAIDPGTYVAFRRVVPVTAVTRLPLRPFITWTVSHGITPATWRLVFVQAGFELWKGGAGLATGSFSLTPW